MVLLPTTGYTPYTFISTRSLTLTLHLLPYSNVKKTLTVFTAQLTDIIKSDITVLEVHIYSKYLS